MGTQTKIKYSVYTDPNITNQTKTIDLSISADKGMYVIHRALIKQLHEQRQGNANTKTRSEVRGGGRKPWKQKGTGRARSGSTRSPLWKGGGVTFGPKTKEYTKKINKKEKQLALRTILHNKFKNTIIVKDFCSYLDKPNTKQVLKQILDFDIQKNNKVLIIVAQKNINIYLSIKNLQNIELIAANHINIISLLNADRLIITSAALDIIQEVYNT